jgi:flavin-dependent dehydrogenase
MGIVNRHMVPAVQVRVLLAHPMENTEIYFKRDIYGGYGWLFPKGEQANAGIGMRRERGKTPRIREALHRFVAQLEKAGKIIGHPQGATAGWIPVEPFQKVVKGNTLLAGDAAGHTHPITGAGVPQAVVCGKMAGKWAARAVIADDQELLREYDKDWLERFGDILDRASKRRLDLERNWNQFDRVIKRCWVAFREYYGSRA